MEAAICTKCCTSCTQTWPAHPAAARCEGIAPPPTQPPQGCLLLKHVCMLVYTKGLSLHTDLAAARCAGTAPPPTQPPPGCLLQAPCGSADANGHQQLGWQQQRMLQLRRRWTTAEQAARQSGVLHGRLISSTDLEYPGQQSGC
jgi:hypothetical protein